MKKFLVWGVMVAALLTGCAKADNFIGVWENKTAVVPWIKVEQDGEYYKVSSPITGPIKAIKKDGVLYISDCEFREPLHYDAKTKELVYNAVRYSRK